MKILLIDMDGVLVNFLIHWLSYLDLYFGIHLKPSDVTSWNLHETKAAQAARIKKGWTEEQLKAAIVAPFSMPGFWRTVPLMVGVREFIEALKKRRENNSFEFYFVTAPSSPVCCKEKVEVITEVFGKDVPYIITKHKHLVRGDMLVDDHPENCANWLKANQQGVAILPDSPYCDNEWNNLTEFTKGQVEDRVEVVRDLMEGGGFGAILQTIDTELKLTPPKDEQ